MPALTQRTTLERLLTDEVYNRAWRYAARLSSTREDAEDLLQDSLATAVSKINGLRDQTKFSGWLLSIIRHRFIDRCRRLKARPQADELPDQLAATNSDHADDPLGVLVGTGLAKLPPEQRELLSLFYADGLNLEETGEVLGIPAKAVRQRLYRARLALRRAIDQVELFKPEVLETAGECSGGGERYGS